MTGAVRAEILTSLAQVRDEVERQVASLDRYRALKSIEQTIADFPDLEDLNRSLSDIRERMQLQIEETRELRALRAVDKIMPDLAEILAFLTERSDAETVQAAEQVSDGSPDSRPASNESQQDDDAPLADTDTPVFAASAELLEASEEISSAQPSTLETSSGPRPVSEAIEVADPGDARIAANDAGSSDHSEISTQTSYGIAQFLNLDEEPPGLPAATPREDEDDPAQFRTPSSQEGRAA